MKNERRKSKKRDILNIIKTWWKEEKWKKLYPNLYYTKVEEITIETLIKNKIKLLILDVDNTLIDYYKTYQKK